MIRRVALICCLVLALGFVVDAQEAAPLTPPPVAQEECLPAIGGDSAATPVAKCVVCSVDQQRDCDASCVQRGFLGGSCCTCNTKCLCSGQDPQDVCV